MRRLDLNNNGDRQIAKSLAKEGRGCTTNSGEWIPPEDLQELVSWWDEFLAHPTRIIRVEGGMITDVEKC